MTSGSGGFGAYYAATREGGPRSTLLHALASFEREPPHDQALAIDLGCGTGRDTLELLRRGWRVLAIDAEPDAVAELRRRAQGHAENLETRVVRFDEVELPSARLVNSSFALPLCPPEHFPRLWQRIRAALVEGGRFAGQLFGPHDGWADRKPPITIHDRPAAEALFAGMAIEMFEEEETDAVTPRGQPKHWHIFHVVARRP